MEVTLKELFSRGKESFIKLTTYDLNPGSGEFKVCLRQTLSDLEEVLRSIKVLDIFSYNETLEDISTKDIKYLCTNALLGHLIHQFGEGDRIEVLESSKIHLIDFLELCARCEVEVEVESSCSVLQDSKVPANLKSSAEHRQTKIARYKKIKELEGQIKALSDKVESQPSTLPVDEELQRELLLNEAKLWIRRSEDTLESIENELQTVKGMKELKLKEDPKEAKSSNTGSKPKSFIITKDVISKHVFGAGYPSLPTMTVEEFYEQQYKNIKPAEHNQSSSAGKTSEEDKDEDDSETEEAIKKAREWDAFRDDHKRGSGNRHNMS